MPVALALRRSRFSSSRRTARWIISREILQPRSTKLLQLLVQLRGSSSASPELLAELLRARREHVAEAERLRHAVAVTALPGTSARCSRTLACSRRLAQHALERAGVVAAAAPGRARRARCRCSASSSASSSSSCWNSAGSSCRAPPCERPAAALTISPNAREVEVEELVEGRHVDGALHHRGAQHVLQRRRGRRGRARAARAKRVDVLRDRDPHAVLAQQADELDDLVVHA